MHHDGEDLAKVLAPLWARKWLIVAAALLVAVATYAYYDHKQRVYASETTVLLGMSKLEEILRGAATPLNERILNNQAALLMSARYSEAVRERLARQGQPAAEPFSVWVTPSEASDFLSIEARSASAETSALVANALARELIDQRARQAKAAYRAAAAATRDQADRITGSDPASLEERKQLLDRVSELETYASVSKADAQQVDVAQPAAAPLTPRPVRNAVFGFVLGLTFACGVVWVGSRLDRRIRSLADVERLFSRPVLAAIPPLRAAIRVGVQGPEPADGVREPLRRVLTTLHLHRQHVDRQETGSEDDDLARARRILVTSAQGGEGKSVVAANLALVARELGAEVALIDGDLDGSALSRLLGVGAVPGLSDVGAGRVPIEEAWQRVANLEQEPITIGPNGLPLQNGGPSASEVMVLTSGSRDRTSAGTVTDSVPAVLDWSEPRFDYVIVDCPPPLAVSDVLPLLSEVDAVVVVSRWGETKVATAERLVELLERLPRVPFLGVIANDVPDDERNAFGFVSVRRS